MTNHGAHIINIDFNALYYNLRKKEGRIYSDKEIVALPEIHEGHPHYKEWQMRKRSCNQLTQYLISKKRQISILEIGCGNGWLAAKLSATTAGAVTAVDVNTAELEQAKRVFKHIHNLQFIVGDPRLDVLENLKYDVIVLAASVQYFSSPAEILDISLNHLQPGGEIHILDTHFYKPGEVAEAQERSCQYFQSIGFPAMKDFYFHHCIDDLKNYNYKIMYNPNFITHQLLKNKNPFYWICIYGRV